MLCRKGLLVCSETDWRHCRNGINVFFQLTWLDMVAYSVICCQAILF